MKRKLVGTLVALGIAAATATTGTFSDFQSSATTVNKVETGHMLIEVNREYPDPLFFTFPSEGSPASWKDGFWQPGMESAVKTMVIKNSGTVDTILKGISGVVEDTNITDPAVLTQFNQWLEVKIYNGMPSPASSVYEGTLNDLMTATQPLAKQNTLLPYNAALNPNDYETPLYVQIKMSRNADNSVMGKYVKFSLQLHSAQP